ncbi:cytochrome P450 [Hyalangium sp.]|uniref:cytochrome P450 n=1 Tax=Hyalangium sp. TaxID=2028555 RepID=UPI002D67238C|nr:cytochrome P450 [Hyalangium sp.]HYH94419.1 cytochrome P450 [Hyalangium sp.]
MESLLGQEYRPLELPQLEDPHPFLARLRREAPVVLAPTFQLWLITRYQDVLSILKDSRRFSSQDILRSPLELPREVTAVLEEAGFTQDYPLLGDDPPAHTRIRGFVGKAFSAARMAALAPRIQQIATEYLDAFPRREGRTDVVAGLTYPLPMRVATELLGIPQEDMDRIKKWCEEPIQLFNSGQTPEQQLERAQRIAAYWLYLRALVEERRRNPRPDDILTTLIEARIEGEKPLDTREMVNLASVLVFAAQETTTNLLGNALIHLLRHPESWRALCEEPARIPQAVEEVLRYDAPASAMMRSTTEDVVLSGTPVPQGSRLLLLFNSANRDEDIYEQADRFDITRESAARHLGFGYGTHFCVGAPLARLQARITLETLTQRLPGLSLVAGERPVYLPNLLNRGPQRLMVEWKA